MEWIFWYVGGDFWANPQRWTTASKIKKTMLAGLIAGLMLPAIPAMAQMYNDKTLEYSDSAMELSAGDTATNTTINGEHNISPVEVTLQVRLLMKEFR